MGRSLHIRLHAYAPDGTSLGMLPRPLGVDADFQHNDAGTLKVTYSRLAIGGTILQRGLEQGLAIGFEVSDGGEWIEPYNARFVLTSRSRDAKDRSDTVTLNLMTYAWLLKKALLLDTSKLLADGDNKGKRPFYSANPGTIVKTMLDENRSRGGVAQYVTAGFDTGKDSSGAAWSNVMTLYYDPGVDCFTALSNLAANGVCDWRTRGMTLNMWNADSAALCHDLSGGIVIPLATQALESPEEETIEDLASHILVMGDGIDFTQDNNAAPTPWGKWELYSSQGGVSDEGTARLLMQSQLDQAARVRGQYTRSVLVTDVDALPLIDYAPGDWITAPTVSHGEKVRVQRVTISLSNQGLKAALILNDRLYDAQTRQAKRIQGITGGAVAGGAQGGRPAPAQDHRVPKAPQGLTLASDAYLDSTGHARGLVSAVWGEVSQATDNTAIEIDSYRVEWRYSDESDKWRSAGVTSDERLSWSNLDCGRTVVVRVRAIPTYSDRNGEWSGEKSVTVASDVTPPSVPSAPRLSSETGIVSISWDGLPATGTGMDADFDHCEVGRGLTPGSLAVVSASMTGRTQWVDTDVLPGAVWTYALRAVDHAGNKSAWSKTAQIEVVGAVSQEQIDKIQSDLQQAQSDLDKAEGTLDRVQSDLSGVESGLEQANKELDSVAADAADAVRQAQEAYEQATNAKKTADGLHNIFKGWQDPATMSGVTVKTGDFWYRTQQYWTTSQGDPDNSPSLLANFYTYAQGEPDNSPSVLVPLESEVVEVLTWDGTRWNRFDLVASNVIASGSIVGDLIAANAITAGHLSAGSVTTDKLVSLAVTADKLAANSVIAGKIAANAVTTGALAALAVTADKLAANSVTAGKIAAGAVTADKLAANSVTAVAIAAGSITSDKIKAGQFQGYVFTGAIYQSSTAENTGFKLRDAGLDMWDSEHNHTVHLDGDGATNVVTGRFKTAFDGPRIEFSTATVDDPQMGEIYTGAIDFHDSEGLVGQLYATSSGSGIGLIKIQPAGSQIAQMTVQRYSSSLTSEVGTTISANDGTGKTASVGANVLPNPSIGMTGALGKNGTFSWFQWKALDAGFGVNSYAHGTVNAMPLRYGRYYAWANADTNWAGIVAHVENTGGTSGWGVVFWNCDVNAAGGDIYCMTMGINAS